jgi:peptidyl-prolyl cis-trans isomerase SurA
MLRSILLVVLVTSFSVHARSVDHIVAIVNDQIITTTDAESFKKNLNSGGMVDDALLQMADPKKMATDREALLEFMIDEKLLDSDVKHKGLEVTVERVEAEIHDLMQKRGINRDQLKEVLKGRGVTMAQYQDYIKTSLERHSLIEKEISAKIRISDEDISSYYLSKKGGDSKNQIYEYTLAHILLPLKKGQEQKAMLKANEALEKLKSGQSFEKIAEQYSEDPNFTKGGALGTFTSGELQPEVEIVVTKLWPGEHSKVIKTKTGLNIFKVLKRSLISDPKLEAQKEEIRGALFAEAFKKQFRSWLTERRQEAFVKINGWT